MSDAMFREQFGPQAQKGPKSSPKIVRPISRISNTKPPEYAAAVAARLARDPNGTLGRGAAWDRLIAALRPGRYVVVYVSSLADGSGGDDRCAPGDAALDPGDARLVGWSAARWIAYNARRAGLPTMGENPGRRDSAAYGAAMLQTAVAQVVSCGMLGLMWTHDAELYQATSAVTLADYAATIRRYGVDRYEPRDEQTPLPPLPDNP